MSVIRRLGEVDQAANRNFEGEIREFVRRDASRRAAREAAAGPGVDTANDLINQVAGASIAEIDRLIAELQRMRNMLQREGERVRHELSGYAGLSQSAMHSMKVISDTLAQFKPDAYPTRSDAG